MEVSAGFRRLMDRLGKAASANGRTKIRKNRRAFGPGRVRTLNATFRLLDPPPLNSPPPGALSGQEALLVPPLSLPRARADFGEALLERLGDVLVGIWAVFGGSWATSELSWAGSCAVLVGSWATTEPSWAVYSIGAS